MTGENDNRVTVRRPELKTRVLVSKGSPAERTSVGLECPLDQIFPQPRPLIDKYGIDSLNSVTTTFSVLGFRGFPLLFRSVDWSRHQTRWVRVSELERLIVK